jgi:hypothetical protein
VRIVLTQEKRLYVLENSIPNTSSEDAKEEVRNEHQRHVDDDEQNIRVMLASISLELQRQYRNMDVHTMVMHLKEIFDDASWIERYETSNKLFRYKMIEGSSMNTYILKMIDYIEKLAN